MKEIILISAIIFIISSFSLVAASITCSQCTDSNCTCTITDCQNGLVDVYSSPFCSGNPNLEFDFSSGSLNWQPGSNNIFYLLALCDDGKTQSTCTRVSLKAETTTTTTRTPTQTTPATKPSQGSNTLTIVVSIVVILFVLAFAIYFLFSRKGSKQSYDDLYKKYRSYR